VLAVEPAAVDEQDVTIDVVGGGGCEEHGSATQILRCAPAASGDAFEDSLGAFRILLQRLGIVGGKVTGSNSVDLHTLACPLVGKGLGKLADAALGCSISGHVDATLEGEQRGDVDDLSGALGEHLAAGILAEPEDAVQVHVDNGLPVLGGVLSGRSAADDAGVVDEDVDGAEVGDGLVHEPVADLELAHIAGERNRAAAEAGNVVGNLLRRGTGAVHSHVGASFSQRNGNALADAARGAGDQRILTLQVEQVEDQGDVLSGGGSGATAPTSGCGRTEEIAAPRADNVKHNDLFQTGATARDAGFGTIRLVNVNSWSAFEAPAESWFLDNEGRGCCLIGEIALNFDLAKLPTSVGYKLLVGLVAPRPIALITSMAADGSLNAAPFSAYNYLATDPPMVGVGVAYHSGEPPVPKDTAANIVETGEFVINVVTEDLAEAMNICAIDFPRGESELEAAGLETASSAVVRVPRIARAHAALECRLHSMIEVSAHSRIILGRVVGVYAEDRFVDPAGPYIKAEELLPIGRMNGLGNYVHTRDAFFTMNRIKLEDWKGGKRK